MEFIGNIFNSRFGNFIIMIGIIVLFVVFLRLLYGPKGFLRKTLWDGIEDDDTSNDIGTNNINTSDVDADKAKKNLIETRNR